ncbi:MAG: DUF1611 domain-containing protein [Myxococcota bacterium]
MKAVVLCEGHFADANGKTAHGLVRYGERFSVQAVIDSTLAGRDAGEVLDGKRRGIPIVASLAEAPIAECLIVGVATDGGRLPPAYRAVLLDALARGLHLVCGLHEKLNDDPEIVALAKAKGLTLEDARATPPIEEMHFFTGEIEEVGCPTIAVLGTDSAIGKRTTARLLVQGLREAGRHAVFVGTGQTARLQGARYGLILDRIPNDFLTGEIEHQVVRAWREEKPDFIVIEGQGGITHPAYPGGYEIICGARVKGVVLMHAPGRATLDGFPQYPMEDPERAVRICELMSGHPIAGLALNHEGLDHAVMGRIAREYQARFDVPVCDPLWDGVTPLVEGLCDRFPRSRA